MENPRTVETEKNPAIEAAEKEVSLRLPPHYVVIPLSYYDALVGMFVQVQKGDYVKKEEVETQVEEAVRSALETMTQSLRARIPKTKGARHGKTPDRQTAAEHS